jgi:hypothetical protein
MCSYEHFSACRSLQRRSRFARRTRSVKAKPIARVERSPKTSLGSFRDWKRCDPTTAQKTFAAEGEALEHALTKSLPDSERGHQELVLLGTPLPGLDHQGRMQK